MRRDKALQLLGITRHAFYYRPKSGSRGIKPNEDTRKVNSKGKIKMVNTAALLKEIVRIKSNPETDYGYRAMTVGLQLKGYIINKKKTYRIMDSHHLLHGKAKRSEKRYVKHRRADPSIPLEVIEMDIKFQWVTAHQRYAFILTILDCFTRKALYWSVAYSLKQEQVIAAWEDVIVHYLQAHNMIEKRITIETRNDNDSRFAAQMVQQYLAQNGLKQVFTHPYTPEENGHIESFHSIMGRSLERRGPFDTLADLEQHLSQFYFHYNQVRLHGSLDHLSPDMFSHLWKQGLISSVERKNKSRRHKLNVPHYLLLGNGFSEGAFGSPLRAKKIPPLHGDGIHYYNFRSKGNRRSHSAEQN